MPHRTLLGLWVMMLIASGPWGCATTDPAVTAPPQPPVRQAQALTPQPQPIRLGPAGSHPLAFYRLMFRSPIGAEIAAVADHLLDEAAFPYNGSEEFTLIASQELRAAGYAVLGMESLLFDTDHWSKARYRLGGLVTHLALQAGGQDAETHDAALTITWQLYDSVEQQVLYETTTTGASAPADSVAAAVVSAFRRALHGLLANAAFVAQVTKPAGSAEPRPSSWEATPVAVTCPQAEPYTLPADLDKVVERVVIVRPSAGFGSGVIVSAAGHVLTAAHLVAGRDEVEVQLHSELRLPARVERVDRQQDVALLQLPGTGYSCLALRVEQVPGLGTELYAIGTPWKRDLAFSVAKGVVSGYRQFQGATYVQTDASLNPGNSGGPLVDTTGQVVGIVSWKAGGEYEGLAFGSQIPVIAQRLGLQRRREAGRSLVSPVAK